MQLHGFQIKISHVNATHRKTKILLEKFAALLTVHRALARGFRWADPALRRHRLHVLALLTWTLARGLSLSLGLPLCFVLR